MSFDEIAANIGLEEEEFLDLVQVFIDASKEDLVRLRSALDHRLEEEVLSVSHSLKGAALSFGFEDISELARIIESRARQGILEGSDDAAKAISERVEFLALELQTRMGSPIS